MTTTQTQRHTPAPWRVSDIEGCRVIDSHDVIIAATGLVKLNNWPRTIYEEQANARLIAAAPGLLEALRVSADVLRQAQGSLSHASGCPRNSRSTADCQCVKAVLQQTEDEARAAIAKAEG